MNGGYSQGEGAASFQGGQPHPATLMHAQLIHQVRQRTGYIVATCTCRYASNLNQRTRPTSVANSAFLLATNHSYMPVSTVPTQCISLHADHVLSAQKL